MFVPDLLPAEDEPLAIPTWDESPLGYRIKRVPLVSPGFFRGILAPTYCITPKMKEGLERNK
jgi:hypothetical protein